VATGLKKSTPVRCPCLPLSCNDSLEERAVAASLTSPARSHRQVGAGQGTLLNATEGLQPASERSQHHRARHRRNPVSAPTLGLRIIGRLLTVILLGFTVGLQADRRSNEDGAAAAFYAGPILPWTIEFPEESLAALRRDPKAYVRGRLQVGHQQVGSVGFHLKGSAGSKRSVDDKPSWTVDINRYQPKRTLFGQAKFHLNNSVQDASYLNQNLASRVYRAAGIPATRSTHALVTVNGRDLGIYIVVETYDDRYLRRAFPEEGSRPGNLYEGGFVADIDRRLQRDAGYGPDDQADLRALREATEVAIPERLAALQRTLDVDQFLTFSALQLALDDWDGYLRNRNNYRIHFRATDGRAIFLPSGVDQLLIHAEAPVRDGWRSRLPSALFQIPGVALQLRSRLRELTSNVLSESFLTHELTQIQARLDTAVATRSSADPSRLFSDRDNALLRVRQRLQVLRRELESWPDPLPRWASGQRVVPTGWQPYVQHGEADVTAATNAPIHLVARRAGTIASLRTSLTIPAGAYRLAAQARTHAVVPVRDQFGSGAGVRLTGSSRTQSMAGTTDETPVFYDFEQTDDGPVELILELRADAGEVWFDHVEVIAR